MTGNSSSIGIDEFTRLNGKPVFHMGLYLGQIYYQPNNENGVSSHPLPCTQVVNRTTFVCKDSNHIAFIYLHVHVYCRMLRTCFQFLHCVSFAIVTFNFIFDCENSQRDTSILQHRPDLCMNQMWSSSNSLSFTK